MSIASPPRVNVASIMSQLTAISRRLRVEFTPYSMTGRELDYARFDPKNPRAQGQLGVLIQTREDIPRERFVERLPFDSSQNPQHSLAEEWCAMQSIVDGAGREARPLADIVKSDDEQRTEAASRIKSLLAPPTPGVSIVSVEDDFSDYRKAFLVSVRSAMLLSLLLGESHPEVADRFFQAAVNLLQMDRSPAAAMFAEVANDRLASNPSFAKRSRWHRAFATKAWQGSLNPSDPYEVARFKIDRWIYHGWIDEDSRVMTKAYLASEELNAKHKFYDKAVGDMLGAAHLVLDRGVKSLGEREAVGAAALFVSRAAESAAKVPRIKGSADLLKDLHRRMIGEAP